MGSIGSNGGIIGPRRVPSPGAASGIWFPREQAIARSVSRWPASVFNFRFWRFDSLTATGTSPLEPSEWVLVKSGTYVTGGTWTWSGTGFSSTSSAAMSNTVLSAPAFTLAHPVASTSFLEYDHGSVVQCTGFQYSRWSAYSTRWLTGVRVLGSADGIEYAVIRTLASMGQDQGSNSVLSPEYSFATP